MMMSSLPSDLVEEILSRVPVKSMGVVRSTCKTWNALSNDWIFTTKHFGKASKEKEFLMITGDYRAYLISVNLYKTGNNKFDLSINPKGKLITREKSDQVLSISLVFHCNGLLLCLMKDFYNWLVVCNPYLGKRRWINYPKFRGDDWFTFGYDKFCSTHKILRFYNRNFNMDIYDLSSNSWKAICYTIDRNMTVYTFGVSLQGNTYWFANDMETKNGFLLCFDFTRETFGPRLPMPCNSSPGRNVSLSAVREEQLALLMQPWDTTFLMEIWVTNKIEPHAVSWSNFIKVNMWPLSKCIGFSNFFIDEEKKIAVVFGGSNCMFKTYIIGQTGYVRIVDLRKSSDIQLHQFVSSYVPTCVQIK